MRPTISRRLSISIFPIMLATLLFLCSQVSIQAQAPPDSELCAREGERCEFTGTREVKYGAQGKYYSKTLTGGATCNVETFGGDPTPNVLKRCYLVNLPANPNGSYDLSGTWKMYNARGVAYDKTATIKQTGLNLTIDNGYNSLSQATLVKNQFTTSDGLTGVISPNGDRIDWNNRFWWVKLASAPANNTIGNEEDLAQRAAERETERPIAGVNQIQKPYFDNHTKISFISDNGMRMTRCRNCQESIGNVLPDTVVLTSDPVGFNSTFEIEMVASGNTRDTSRSVLRTGKGESVATCYDCIVNNPLAPQVIGIVGADTQHLLGRLLKDLVGFELAQLSNGNYTLKASNGKYVGRCSGCSPSFMSRTGGVDIVAPIFDDPNKPWVQWSIQVVAPSYGKFPADPNAQPTKFVSDPQGLFTKSIAQLEQDCADQVQGVVAWDNAGSKTWDKATLTRLCRVTENPWETIACFKLKLKETGNLETSISECSNSPDSPGFLARLHARRNSGGSIAPSELPNANQPLDSNEMGLVMSWIANQVNAMKTPFCWRNSFTRTGGTNPPTPGGDCPAGLEKSGTTCFPPCNKKGYDGVSFVCWQRCPSHTPVNCGLGCATDAGTCGWTIFDQVSGPLTLVAFAASKGGSSDKTEAAEVAINAGKMEKAIASLKSTIKAAETGIDAALLTKEGYASTAELVKIIKAGKKIQGATDSLATRMQDLTDDFVRAYTANFAAQTSPEIERKINEKFGPKGAAEIKKQWALINLTATLSYSLVREMKDIMSIVSVFDPSGLTATINAYTHPVCAPDVDFPNLHPRSLD